MMIFDQQLLGGDQPMDVKFPDAATIATYHRAVGFTLDVTHVLPYLLQGGMRHMILTVGGQSYATTLRFRLRNASKGLRPTRTQFLYWLPARVPRRRQRGQL